MVRVLIAENNMIIIKRLINTIISKVENSQIINISTDYNEAYITVNELCPELILTNKTFNFLKVLNKEFYSPQIVYIEDIKTKEQFQAIISKHEKNKSQQKIESINNIINYNKLVKRVYNYLLKINFNPQMVGTQYLADAITFAYLNKDQDVLENFTKSIYPEVAARNNSTRRCCKMGYNKMY
ncbi:MAG: hypothetical protein IKG42_02970 [Clostridia bacterium]|nr:hypothetical protein [Clostridia bacterium]